MIRTLRECPGDRRRLVHSRGRAACRPGVLAHRADGADRLVLFLHNLGDQDATVDLSALEAEAEPPDEMLADQRVRRARNLSKLAVAGYGYRWIRLCRHLSPPRAGTQ